MKKNILIVVLALIVVGGGGFVAGEKLGEKNATPETTVENTTIENTTDEVVMDYVVPKTTEKIVEEVEPEIGVVVTEKIIYVTEATKEPETEAVKPTEKVTEAITKVNKTEEKAETTKNSAEKITREKAKGIALNHAGLKEADIRELEIELDKEKGVLVYEVSFESGKYDYEYDIDAYTGAIKFSGKDLDD